MKLNYRDKMILSAVLAVAILLAGFFALIKPKTQAIEENQATLETRQAEQAEIEKQIAKIEPLKTEIKSTYTDTNDLAKIFVPVEDIDNSIMLDEYMQEKAEENNVKIIKLELSSTVVAPLEYYYFEEDDISSELREAADFSGELQEAYDAAHREQNSLSEREVENVLKTQYGLQIVGTKENVWNYLKAIADINNAVMIDSVDIKDYSFGEDAAESAGQQVVSAAPAEGEEGTEEGEEAAAPVVISSTALTDESEVQIVISLYSVYTMSEPDTEMAN